MAEEYTIEEPGDESVRVYDLPLTEEAQAFECSYKFVENRQHDHHSMLWDGQSRVTENANYLRERYYPRSYAPVDPGPAAARKPELTTPMASTITMRNTGLLLGTDPKIEMPVSDDSQELIRAMYRAGNLRGGFALGRNMAGGGGASVLIPGVIGGRPRLTVGRPSEFRVLKWSEREPWQPARVVQQVLVPRQVRDRAGHKLIKNFWQTTEWDETHRFTYKLVPEEYDRDEPIERDSTVPPILHGCTGRCPVTWYKNSETNWCLGDTDFGGLEPRFDAVDRLGTHLYTAVGKNCDPTVYQADDEGTRRRHLISKRGRGVIAQLSENGRLGALEIAGTSLEITWKFWRSLTDDTYATADCVRVTPDTAGAFRTGEAIRLLWRASEVRVGWLWPPLADAIRRVLECMYSMAETFGVSSVERPSPGTFILPSRVVPAERPKPAPAAPPPPPELDEDGAAIPAPPARPVPALAAPREEKPRPTLRPHKIGAFGHIDIQPGSYFAKTPGEKQAELTTVQAAAGGAPVISQETAVEEAANALGRDPDEELRRVHEEAERSIDSFGGGGGALAAAGAEAEEDAADETSRGTAKPGKGEDEGDEDEAGEAE